MKFTIDRDILSENINSALRFTSNKLSTVPTLQGVYMKSEKQTLHFYATNLSSYFHSQIPLDAADDFKYVVDGRRILEFVTLLPAGLIEVEVGDKQIHIGKGKTKGTFAFMVGADFPLPPEFVEKEQKIKADFFIHNLPYVLFSASSDDSRPTLTGINFVTADDLVIVSTDGFRLSLLRVKKEVDIPSVIIPASFLGEVLKYCKSTKEVLFTYSPSEKMVRFSVGHMQFYSRLIDGEFPQFDRVIPAEQNTTVTLDREELLRNVKLISVFARDFSNVIVFDFTKDGLSIHPKSDTGSENQAFQQITITGEDQKIAFNYRFLLDFLSHIDEEKIIIELVRPNAPAVFKSEKNKDFLHIIMPVRIQE